MNEPFISLFTSSTLISSAVSFVFIYFADFPAFLRKGVFFLLIYGYRDIIYAFGILSHYCTYDESIFYCSEACLFTLPMVLFHDKRFFILKQMNL